jgi:GntR family transcriptional repressor for pyruvate dehydrogenase complex
MSFDLQPLSTEKRPDAVFDQLRARILAGDLRAGARLPTERDLAVALGVNRASVREALKRLEFLELVDVVHGQGTFVRALAGSSALQLVEALLRDPRTVTPELMRQLLEFRRDVTGRVVELAAANRTEAQLEQARALLARERDEGADPETALAIDLEWNRLLGEATGNLMYQLVSNLFTKLVARLGPLYYNRSRDFARSHATHAELLSAIEARDPAQARRVLERMLAYSDAAILGAAERLSAEGRIGPAARRP